MFQPFRVSVLVRTFFINLLHLLDFKTTSLINLFKVKKAIKGL